MNSAYYNEFDKFAAAWLRELIKAGLIMDGEVDERSIHDVQPADLKGFTRCHFFAGIGGWDYALQLANWPDNRPVWTGSCPCPPFSSAGKKKRCPECDEKPIPHPLKTGVFACIGCGHEWHADDRHLWPEFYRIIRDYQDQIGPPPTIFGEQVAGPDGLVWFDGVRATLEALGLAVAGSDLCSAGVGKPHKRQRIGWVADAEVCGDGAPEVAPGDQQGETAGGQQQPRGFGGGDRGMVQSSSGRRPAGHQTTQANRHGCAVESAGGLCGVAQGDTNNSRPQGHAEHGASSCKSRRVNEAQSRSNLPAGGDSYKFVRCLEPTKEPGRFVEKWRRIEPGTLPLAHWVPGRVGRLRGYGNAIDPDLFAEFIAAYMETTVTE